MDAKKILKTEDLREVKEGDLVSFVGRPPTCDLYKSPELVIFSEYSDDSLEIHTIRRSRFAPKGERYIQRSVYVNSILPITFSTSSRNLPDFPFTEYDNRLNEVINCEM
jgi:hypothetical protein